MPAVISQSEIDLDTYPALKPGVQVIPHSTDATYVGFSDYGIELQSVSGNSNQVQPNFITLTLGLFNGQRNFRKILSALSSHFAQTISIDEIRNLIESLLENNLLEISTESSIEPISTTASKRGGKLIAQNQINFLARLNPELNLTAWQRRTERSARSCVIDRAKFSILIFGSNRLAFSLYALLQASGFSATKIIDRNRPTPEIGTDLVCGSTIKTSDIGLKSRDVLAQIKRDTQLNFADEITFPAIPSFIIATSVIAPDNVQRWLSEAIPHLLIGNLTRSQIEIGPIVIPGKTPCYQCLEFWRSENNPNHQLVNLLHSVGDPLELSAAAVSAIAGLVVLNICEFAATSDSKLIGAVANLDLLNPYAPEMQYWHPHKDCGCQY